MHRRPPLFSAFKVTGLGLVTAFFLAACSTTETAAPLPCPEILIPADGAKLARFKPGPGRDIIDILHEEEVTGFAHMCQYDTDNTGAGEVAVLVAPTVESLRGPADTTAQATFEYFIAVVDSQDNVMEVAKFPVTIPFLQNLDRVIWQRQDPVVLRIPLAAGQNGTDFRIFVGLQLTRDELKYQRKIRQTTQ